MFGLCMVLFLAGIQKIPLVAVRGRAGRRRGPVREFFAVTLPGLRGELAVALTLTTIMALRSFDLIYVATNGGPGSSTTVPGVLVYRNAFGNGARRAGRGGRRGADADHLRGGVRDHEGRRPGPVAMTARAASRLLSYVVLGVFAIVAIYPILIDRPARVPPQERPRHGLLDPGPPELRHVQPRVGRSAASTTACVNSFIVAATVAVVTAILATPRATRSGRCASAARACCSTCC